MSVDLTRRSNALKANDRARACDYRPSMIAIALGRGDVFGYLTKPSRWERGGFRRCSWRPGVVPGELAGRRGVAGVSVAGATIATRRAGVRGRPGVSLAVVVAALGGSLFGVSSAVQVSRYCVSAQSESEHHGQLANRSKAIIRPP